MTPGAYLEELRCKMVQVNILATGHHVMVLSRTRSGETPAARPTSFGLPGGAVDRVAQPGRCHGGAPGAAGHPLQHNSQAPAKGRIHFTGSP